MTGGETGPPVMTSGGGGGGDPACRPAGGTTGAGGTSGPKFDVGGSGGGVDLPVSCEELSDARSNLGCVFWAVDLPNDWNGTDVSPPAAEQPFAVVVANTSALEDAQVSVYLGAGTQPIDSAVVPVDGTVTFVLTGGDIPPTMPGTDGQAFRIESDRPVTAYQFNPLDNVNPVYSNDASLLLPEHVLGTDHAVLTGDGILLSTGPNDPDPDPAGAFVVVVATKDGTEVTVEPSGTTLDGPLDAVPLDRGQVLSVLSNGAAAGSNLSGSRVWATAEVAVFSGNVATAEPAGAGKCCADHIEHQVPPIEVWGTAYVVVPPPAVSGTGDDPAVIRVVAAYDGTAVGYCPGRPATAPTDLDGFAAVRFEADEPFVIRSLDPAKPLFVGQFLKSNQALPGAGPSGDGDPAFVVVPPVDQFQRKYVFVVPQGYTGGNYVTVVTPDPTALEIDGAAVDAEFREAGVVSGVLYHYAHVPLEAGAHRLVSEVPVGIRVVGYDEAVSHGYPGGAGLSVIAVPPVAG